MNTRHCNCICHWMRYCFPLEILYCCMIRCWSIILPTTGRRSNSGARLLSIPFTECASDPEFLHVGGSEHNLAPFGTQRYVGILQTGEQESLCVCHLHSRLHAQCLKIGEKKTLVISKVCGFFFLVRCSKHRPVLPWTKQHLIIRFFL